ncbi:hypothetical protein FXO37_19767 [Capsicum annuum]|nr:hypothetical protein FXO37_19767 [Capsicum annuum]
MHRFGNFPLAFQYWYYEYCPYANGNLADRVGESVPRIPNWSVKHRLTYKDVKSAFFNIRQEQVVLSNITPSVLEKSILQLLDFKFVTVVVKFGDLPGTSKQGYSHLISGHDLTLLRILRSDVNLLCFATPTGDNNGDNSKKKNDDQPNMGGIVDNQVDDPPNNELDWSEILDTEISKFTQPDKSIAVIDTTAIVGDDVRKVDANASDNIKGLYRIHLGLLPFNTLNTSLLTTSFSLGTPRIATLNLGNFLELRCTMSKKDQGQSRFLLLDPEWPICFQALLWVEMTVDRRYSSYLSLVPMEVFPMGKLFSFLSKAFYPLGQPSLSLGQKINKVTSALYVHRSVSNGVVVVAEVVTGILMFVIGYHRGLQVVIGYHGGRQIYDRLSRRVSGFDRLSWRASASWNKYEFGGWKSYLDDPCSYCDGPHFWKDCKYAPRREMCAPSPAYWEYNCSFCAHQDGHWSDFLNAPSPYCANPGSSSSYEYDRSYGQEKKERSTGKSDIKAML